MTTPLTTDEMTALFTKMRDRDRQAPRMGEFIDDWTPRNPSEIRLHKALVRKFTAGASWWNVYEWCVDPAATPAPLDRWRAFQTNVLHEEWNGLGWTIRRAAEIPDIGFGNLIRLTKLLHERGCPVTP